jgi:hypothetical protein
MSDTMSTHSSVSDDEKPSDTDKPDPIVDHEPTDANLLQEQAKPNKVKVNKTKSLPSNYEISVTANNSLSPKDNSNLIKNKENNAKPKVSKEKQPIIPIASINGASQNGHPLTEQNNKVREIVNSSQD